jgi:N-acetyl sugar amidotransferase
MDTSDPSIRFDSQGVCSHCHEFDRRAGIQWFPNDEGEQRTRRIVEEITRKGKDKRYDSVIGLSGGIDSTFLALRANDLGLRPLAVHVDGGWNSELAVKNIETVVEYCQFDLFTHVMNWEDMKNLQLAYLRSGVANQDVPQDHAFMANLYHVAKTQQIQYILSGANFATESVSLEGIEHDSRDDVNLKDIYSKYGKEMLTDYRTLGFFTRHFIYPYFYGIKIFHLLDLMPYSRKLANDEIAKRIDYKPYKRKHGESVFTKFFQNYYLVKRFGFDKRRAHLSGRVMSGELTRDQAMKELDEPLYSPQELEEDIDYFCKKLDLSHDEFVKLLDAPCHYASEFKSQRLLRKLVISSKRVFKF